MKKQGQQAFACGLLGSWESCGLHLGLQQIKERNNKGNKARPIRLSVGLCKKLGVKKKEEEG